MKLEYRDGLLFASLTLVHGGRTVTVDNVIVDTGAADTIIDIIAVEPLQLAVDEDDVIVRMVGDVSDLGRVPPMNSVVIIFR